MAEWFNTLEDAQSPHIGPYSCYINTVLNGAQYSKVLNKPSCFYDIQWMH